MSCINLQEVNMKKLLTVIAAGLLFCSFSSNTSLATVNIENTEPGGVVSFSPGVAGAPDPIEFTPSTNVNIGGQSDATSFAINSWHEQASSKTAGQAYGMTSDSNKMFFMDISTTAGSAVTGTTAAAFSGYTTI